VKDLAKPLIRKKIAQTTPTHHEHEPKWEIPGGSSDRETAESLRQLSLEGGNLEADIDQQLARIHAKMKTDIPPEITTPEFVGARLATQ
jgi:hypothetical protein